QVADDTGGEVLVPAPASVQVGAPRPPAGGAAPLVPVEIDARLPGVVDAVVIPLAAGGVTAVARLAPQRGADAALLDELAGLDVLGQHDHLRADLEDLVRVALDNLAQLQRLAKLQRHRL